MTKLINFVNGWKSSIFTCLGLILSFLQARGYIAGDVAVLIAGIFAAFGVSVNLYNARSK